MTALHSETDVISLNTVCKMVIICQEMHLAQTHRETETERMRIKGPRVMYQRAEREKET